MGFDELKGVLREVLLLEKSLNCCVEAFEHLMPRQVLFEQPFPKPRLLHKLLKVGPSVFWGHMGWANDPLHLQGY
eukprot:CAMPEP_0202413940 /NCGR_PEP_ID=MMETSP1128-20130828/31204_1 /ASSEMBLY_ACC=CAM_ASM_000463 /TAXON_ID=3047 /ORGANISM="Dunaliella tertiolecta, Strain CCMP1320" /LENGTH=74 /DNA_ID=CAMNT_0049020237 /DNA_START=998 /DNA_END=1219 /DNA_ORIENTATION=-